MTGNNDMLSNWDPARDSGRGGIQCQWSEGHVWRAELDYQKIREIGPMDFKFVVKESEDNKHFRMRRWEGGDMNHNFDAT